MFNRVTLFHFFGFPVKADASWLFLSILIVWTLTTKFYPAVYPLHSSQVYQMMAFATLIGILASIIAHEVAHAIIAEYYHMPIESITLFIFGGVAELKGEPSHPKGEFLMALAGPAMSVMMGLFFWAAESLYQLYLQPGASSHVLGYLGNMNMIIAAFNMAPAFPLDGGRALRAAIWHFKNNMVLATRIASSLGAFFAYGLLAYAIYRIVWFDDAVQGIWAGLLGLFMHGAGTYAVRQTENRSILGAEKVTRFMHGQIVSVSPDITITELVDNYVYKHYQKIFPVVDKGILVGIITLKAVLALDRSKWSWLHVASVMEKPDGQNTVEPETSAADALDMMQKSRKDSLLITRDGEFMGVVALRDLVAYLSITMKIDPDQPLTMSSRRA
ncbi:MAG: site-2 protease family protein [Micavibrio sp.]|nr:site-2 protease family protein [Micavibrio sp.]